jgi:hypothetical protein
LESFGLAFKIRDVDSDYEMSREVATMACGGGIIARVSLFNTPPSPHPPRSRLR